MSLPFYFILARCENNGIGYKGRLPWQLRKELQYFSRMTKSTTDLNKENAVIMGRLTWEELPPSQRPLPGRLNIVLSSQELKFDNAIHCHNFDEVVDVLNSSQIHRKIETAWIIGGSKVYESALKSNLCDRIYLTEIHMQFPCDTFVDFDLSERFIKISDPRVSNDIQEEDGIQYTFNVYEKVKN